MGNGTQEVAFVITVQITNQVVSEKTRDPMTQRGLAPSQVRVRVDGVKLLVFMHKAILFLRVYSRRASAVSRSYQILQYVLAFYG